MNRGRFERFGQVLSFKVMEIEFFDGPDEIRKWFETNHERITEQWIGFYKKGSGKASITWPESVDAALCFGWIDCVRKSIDEVSYKIRFTPRKRKSIWSAVNIKRAAELREQGLMHPNGLAAFENRDEKRAKLYAYERETVEFSGDFETEFKRNAEAWEFFKTQAPSYRKTITWWVMSAKQEATRQKRLETLIGTCVAGKRVV